MEAVRASSGDAGSTALRVVICDDDPLVRDLVETVAVRVGHDVVGLADTPRYAVALIERLRPDLLIVEVALDYNSDFDLIGLAGAVGATAIVFSHRVRAEMFERYTVKPWIVAKPDLAALERVLAGLEGDQASVGGDGHERRRRPVRASKGRVPSGVEDAQAFFEALNEARPGDALLSIDVTSCAVEVAAVAAQVMRDTDRLLAFPASVRFFLAGGGDEGVQSMLRRLSEVGATPPDGEISSIVVADGELGAAAFDRLKHTADRHSPVPTTGHPSVGRSSGVDQFPVGQPVEPHDLGGHHDHNLCTTVVTHESHHSDGTR